MPPVKLCATLVTVPPVPVADMDIDPTPLVIETPVPAVKTARVNPVPLPMSNAPFAGVVVNPVPPFAIGKVPVTPVVKGKPVVLVNTPDAGVPSAGVISVGLVSKTTLPDPVVVAALIAVPLPFKTPVIDVVSVIAGVVVEVATVPVKPLAETTDTEVTVPVPPTDVQTGAPEP
jgi:hypothetical protein